MEIKIGHYGQNITPTEAKTGGINSPDIIDEQGIGVSAVKSKEIRKNPGKLQNYVETSITPQGWKLELATTDAILDLQTKQKD